MLFSSTVFLFVFLPIVLVTYFLVPRAFKNTILLATSLFFYAWGEPRFVIIMLFSILMNYIFAMIVDTNRANKTKMKLVMTVMVVANLAMIGVFKYANFAVENINSLMGTSFTNPNIPLPIGISFFTFQAIIEKMDKFSVIHLI